MKEKSERQSKRKEVVRERERDPALAERAERACDKFVGYRAERA